MKNAAQAFLEMLELPTTIRPSKVEAALVVMLYTLNKHDLLEELLSDIQAYSSISPTNQQKLSYIKTTTSKPELVGLYDKPKAVQLLLKLMPHIAIAPEYSVITLPESEVVEIINRSRRNHQQAELKKQLLEINRLDLGYKIFQANIGQIGEFHVVKYRSKEDVLRVLKDNKLQMPSVLDKIFT